MPARLGSCGSYNSAFFAITLAGSDTHTHAIEFDFGDHWSEAVGQSAYYAIQTEKKAGIVLILVTMKDQKYWIRLNTTIEHFDLPIKTWSIGNTAY